MSEVVINVTKVEEVVTINATPNVTQILVNTNNTVPQNLNDVLTEGNATDGENIFISDGDEITFDNGSRIRKGLTDAGNGGAKGVALVCSLDYELKWEAGRQYVMQQDGFTIREVSHNFTITPTATDDSTKGFVIDSRWILDNGDIYVCTDASPGDAVWELQITDVQDLQNVTDVGNTTTNEIYIPKLYLYDEPNDNYGSLHYTDGNFHIEDADNHKLLVIEDGFLQLHLTDTIQSNLFLTDLTETRDHYLPDESGTIALTSDIPSVDSTPTDGSANAVSSNGVFDALALKEDTSNKVTTFTGNETSTTKFPIVKAIIDYFTSSRLATILGFTPANDASVVHIAGTETITGSKTFSVDTVINGQRIGRGGGDISSNLMIGNTNNVNTGVGNTFIGKNAGQQSSSGGSNTCVGYEAGQANTLGANNCYLGYLAGGNNINGSNTIALGHNAGRFIADGTTIATIFSTSIFIGQNTKPLANNQTNQIVIGFNSTGLGTNTTVLGNSSTTLTAVYGSTIFGGTSVNASAILQADSTTKGFLPPRMTNAQRIAIVSPAIGLMVYCTDTVAGLYVYKSTGWTFII